jgi:hypothetical protein
MLVSDDFSFLFQAHSPNKIQHSLGTLQNSNQQTTLQLFVFEESIQKRNRTAYPLSYCNLKPLSCSILFYLFIFEEQ